MTVLRVEDPGMGVTVQDLGRPGLARWAVSPAGAADRGAHRLANRLVGNTEDAATLELVGGGQRFRAESEVVVALAGAPLRGTVTRPVEGAGGAGTTAGVGPGHAFVLRSGDVLALERPWAGLRTYLAVRGGVAADGALGSASTDTLGGLGPAPLVAGTTIAAGVLAPDLPRHTPTPQRPLVGEPSLRVLPGPRLDWISDAARDRFAVTRYTVSSEIDRIGVRLDGPRLRWRRDGELASEALLTGSVQLPPNGQPIIFGPDHPTTGGYPVIAVVVEADLDVVAQLRPGQAVRFRWVGA